MNLTIEHNIHNIIIHPNKVKEKQGIIYKLTIGNYYYYGQTKSKLHRRMWNHNKACFNKRGTGYNTKKYKIIRELGVKRNTFKELVKVKIVWKGDISKMNNIEYNCINLDCHYSLNSRKGNK